MARLALALIAVVLAGCAGATPGTSDPLDWNLEPFALAWEEKTGWQGVRGEDTFRRIYLKPGQTSRTWTEKLEVTQLPIAITLSGAVRWNPESIMNDERARVQKSGCSTDGWTVLQLDETSVLYEWPNIRCSGSDRLTQHELVRIVMGRWYLWSLAYGIRGKTLAAEERKQIIAYLAQARVIR